MKNGNDFLRGENGATSLEYGLIAALIAVVIIAAATLVGQEIATDFSLVATTLQGAGS